ncbi:hypothetical protein [Patulibacter americanus]|uniref:hypothetical protein n=1 Tax=Patulibacter americanus TaxID=588672 RepID=UPI0003B551F3|nr:hypothetical protein [Patulibacter americanus]
MRTTPRPRHHINPVAFALLRPALRFSYTREAYVLRVVGNHRGPVFVRTRPADPQLPRDQPGHAETHAPSDPPQADTERQPQARAD